MDKNEALNWLGENLNKSDFGWYWPFREYVEAPGGWSWLSVPHFKDKLILVKYAKNDGIMDFITDRDFNDWIQKELNL